MIPKNPKIMTTQQMLEEYNRLTGKNLKKFTDRATAERRLTEARKAFIKKEIIHKPFIKDVNPDTPEWRYVHAQRARKLRKRGEYVLFDHWTENGRCVYRWTPKQKLLSKMYADLSKKWGNV